MHVARAAAVRGNRRGHNLLGSYYCGLPKESFSTLRHVVSKLGQEDPHDFRSGKEIGLLRNAGETVVPAFHQRTQVRFRRHDRASAFSKPRPPTKKQRKAHNRKKKRIAEKAAKHNPPGSQAGPRRQWVRERWQELLDHGKESPSSEVLDPSSESELYGYGDALLDDLMGNTSYLTAQPTPEPVYTGHRHEKLYKKMAVQMNRYRENLDSQLQTTTSSDPVNGDQKAMLDPTAALADLPSDKSISQVLRAYRDRYGTRNKPVGIAAALEHLLKDLGVPTFVFGEYSYTALLTCCRTPKEARRIFKLMRDQQHPISAYSWSILVDIHSKLADFEGCHQVMKEMASNGVPPTQAAYTSLLSSCYKICNNGRIAHSVRAKAGELGWDQWQEMRIVGIEPDAMAYGAIIRLCAARGQPERAINLLEDMERFDVKPTTLCFSSALRAVARSHATAIRFENGSSRKQLRRETIAAHHGKMARAITIMAENAEVNVDEGFVSALMLCAAEAGDSATAKAVYLAAQVRSMDHLRTIGPNSHLLRLRGGTADDESSKTRSLLELEGDTSQALGEGTSEYPRPEWDGTELPEAEADTSDIAQAEGKPVVSKRRPFPSYGEREYGRDTRALSALMHASSKAVSMDGIGTMWAGSQNQGYLCENSLRLITARRKPEYKDTSIPGVNPTQVGIAALRRFDDHHKELKEKPGVRRRFRGLFMDEDSSTSIDELDDTFANIFAGEKKEGDIDEDMEVEEFIQRQGGKMEITQENGSSHSVEETEEDTEELYFDFDTMRWKSRPRAQPKDQTDGLAVDSLNIEEHGNYFEDESSEESGADSSSESSLELEDDFALSPHDIFFDENIDPGIGESTPSVTRNRVATEHVVTGGKVTDAAIQPLHDQTTDIGLIEPENLPFSREAFVEDDELDASTDSLPVNPETEESIVDQEMLAELANALPGLPVSRLKRIRNTFQASLGYPSLLELVPLLRENMPDYVTATWLKAMNTRNAEFVLEKAKEDEIVDSHLLNAMLEVKTSAGSIDRALEFHHDEFQKHNLTPTGYSDRLVIQMLLGNRRLQRALYFKQSIEEAGRTMDIASYGSLVDYCSRHHQLGSALMLVQECVALHGAPPSEKYLNKVRVLCRQEDLEKAVGLDVLIGEDPTKWLKHGQKFLKREMTRRGRRDVHFAYNRLL